MDVDYTGERSNLVTRLLLRSTSGKGSYGSAQGDAYAAFLDGLKHPEVAQLAACGNWGMLPGNVRRDVRTTFFSKLAYAVTYNVNTPAINPGSPLYQC